MAKFRGKVGYARNVETAPSVYNEEWTIKQCSCDLLENKSKLVDGSVVNPGIRLMNRISIVASPYARKHCHEIRWVEFQNSKWTVSDVTVNYPRLILTLGGLYNGPTQN